MTLLQIWGDLVVLLASFYDLYSPDIINTPVKAFRLYGSTLSYAAQPSQSIYEILNTLLPFGHDLGKNTKTSHYLSGGHHECTLVSSLSCVDSLELVQWSGSYSALCSI